jgi:tRNA-specific adenosine deaminase 2
MRTRAQVPVGCVIVDTRTDRIIGRGYNLTNVQKNASRHCELVAIDDILLRPSSSNGSSNGDNSDNKRYDATVFQHCELYVTCEPCIMCAAAIELVGIPRVYFGCSNVRFGGCGSVYRVAGHDAAASSNGNAAMTDDDDDDNSDSKQQQQQSSFGITGGIYADEAVALFKEFYSRGNPNAPTDKRKRVLKTEAQKQNFKFL